MWKKTKRKWSIVLLFVVGKFLWVCKCLSAIIVICVISFFHLSLIFHKFYSSHHDYENEDDDEFDQFGEIIMNISYYDSINYSLVNPVFVIGFLFYFIFYFVHGIQFGFSLFCCLVTGRGRDREIQRIWKRRWLVLCCK